MNCERCGNEVIENTKFCSNCGLPIIRSAPQEPERREERLFEIGEPGTTHYNWWYILFGIMMLMTAVLVFSLPIDVDLNPVKVIIVSFLLIFAFILFYYAMMPTSTSKYYRNKKGGCRLVQAKNVCTSSCTECVMAQEYIRNLNNKEI